MDEVADGVFRCAGTDVNWVLVREGRDVTLIDGGWRGDARRVEASIRELGCRPEDVHAVLVTHAHIDHLGALGPLYERYAIPAYAHPREVPHAHRRYLEQATPADLIRRIGRHGVLAWSLRVARVGGLRALAAPHTQPFPSSGPPFGPLDLPGGPVPVPSPGHTSGHTSYLLPQAGVLVTGDALVTGHPTSVVVGPQLLPDHFTHAPDDALAALDALAAVDADVILPGHGDPWRGTPGRACDLARERASRY